MALDLRSIASLEPGEAETLQVMREHIRAASVAKMAKVRLWESENMALLQLAGGGGGVELLPFRNLSQHVKVHRLVPDGAGAVDGAGAPAAAAARGAGGSKGGGPPAAGAAGGAALAGAAGRGAVGTGGAARRSSMGAAGKDDDGGVRDSLGGGGSAAPTPEGKEGVAAGERRTSSSLSAKAGMMSKAISSNLSSKGVFGKAGKAQQSAQQASDAAAAAAAAACAGVAEAAWPVGQRLPAAWHAGAQPGALVATLRAHAEGVRQMCTSTDQRLLITRGRDAVVKAWSPHAIVEESAYAPAARHALSGGARVCAMALTADDGLLALGSSDGAVQLIAPERLGAASSATAASFHLAESDGELLSLAALGGGGGPAGGGPAGGSAAFAHTLMYTSEGGHAVALDPRSGKEAWRLRHGAPLGLMQAHASDAAANWLLFGSTTGHCVLWDVRYRLELHSWQCPGAPRIRTMLHVRAPGSARPTVLLGADDNLVSGWEIGEAPRCSLLLQPRDASDAAAAAACAPAAAPSTTLATVRSGAAAAINGPHAVCALLAPLDGSCVLTGSSDTRTRCWRLGAGEVARSFELGAAAPADGAPPSFREQTAAWVPSGCRVLHEVVDARSAAGAGVAPPPPRAAGAVGAVGVEDRGCAAAVTCAAFCAAPQPGLLAVGSLDGTVRLWR